MKSTYLIIEGFIKLLEPNVRNQPRIVYLRNNNYLIFNEKQTCSDVLYSRYKCCI